MNKVHCKMKAFLISLITVCLIFFNISCGLDTVYVIDSPSDRVHDTSADNIDKFDAYFEFVTNEKPYEGINYLGTDVYYRIYGSSTVMASEIAAIDNASINDETGSKAATMMIDTYKYVSLEAIGYYGDDVLIPATGSNRHVYIRLEDSSPYEAAIKIDNNNIYGSETRVIPGRNTPEKTAFTFYNREPNTIPKDGDPDVKYSGANNTDWYVSLFAVGVAMDATYTKLYSNVKYLGSVKITVQ